VARTNTERSIAVESLRIVDKRGRTRIELTGEDMPTISLLDKQGRTRLELVLSDKGDPHVQFWDKRNHLSLAIGVDKKSAGMSIMPYDGKAVIMVGMDENGESMLVVSSAKESSPPKKSKKKSSNRPRKAKRVKRS